jgi:Domain of unknown function (DU1801)
MAANKTQPTELSVAAFIDQLADPLQRADAKALVKVLQKATGEKPKMCGPSIIGFGAYHYKYESGREGDMPLLAFSPRKAATVLYNLTGFKGSDALLAKLGKHSMGKACLNIKKFTDVDPAVLQELAIQSASATRARHPD